MADPKRLTAIEMELIETEIQHYGYLGEGDLHALLSHIAAQDAAIAAKDAEIAKLRAAVRAADALPKVHIWFDHDHERDPDCIGTPTIPMTVCAHCDSEWSGEDEAHNADCPIPAWRTARAAVKLEGGDAKG